MAKQVEICGISLDLNEPVSKEFVPNCTEFMESALDQRNLKKLVAGVKKNYPVLLVGPTGSGKTSTIKWLAYKTNNSYRRLQLNGSTDIDNFVGRWTLNKEGTVWIDGILTDAMRKGHWLLLDEINMALPEILVIINSITDDDRILVLDEKGTEVVEPHPNFRLFASMNPTEDYSGTKELNTATRNRFIEIVVGYPSPDMEVGILEKHSGIDRELGKFYGKDSLKGGANCPKQDVTSGQGIVTFKPLLESMVEFANIIRANNEHQKMLGVCSTRQLIQWANLLDVLPIKNAAYVTILDKMSKEDLKIAVPELDKLFKNDTTLKDFESKQKEFEKIKQGILDKEDGAVLDVLDEPPSATTNTTEDSEADWSVESIEEAFQLLQKELNVSDFPVSNNNV